MHENHCRSPNCAICRVNDARREARNKRLRRINLLLKKDTPTPISVWIVARWRPSTYRTCQSARSGRTCKLVDLADTSESFPPLHRTRSPWFWNKMKFALIGWNGIWETELEDTRKCDSRLGQLGISEIPVTRGYVQPTSIYKFV